MKGDEKNICNDHDFYKWAFGEEQVTLTLETTIRAVNILFI